MDLVELFEIECTDGTKLWATLQNNVVCYGSLGKGFNLVYKDIFKEIPYNHLFNFVYELSKESKYISKYRDIVEEKSNELQRQLLKAF